MGGGALLMAVMVNFLPVKTAMIYHGFIQFFSNFFRALISWKHVSLKIMTLYLIGSFIGSVFLFHLVYHPDKAYILLAMGLLILFGPFLSFAHINVQTPLGALFCGLFVSWINTLAGVSGPLLNMFFLKSGLSKFQVIATKSATQCVAHVIKIVFYMGLLSSLERVSFKEIHPFLFLLCLLTFFGGWIGHAIVSRMSEAGFRKYGFRIISLFGAFFTLQGLYLLIF